MKIRTLQDSGLSEVFGVMLLLSITIIVACIITTFAVGFSFDPAEDSISANLVASEIKIYPGESCAYILFDHLSGDPVDLNSVEINLGIRSSGKERAILKNCNIPTGFNEMGNGLTSYIVNYGEESNMITVGDRFVLYSDGIDTNGIFWKSETSGSKFYAPFDDCLTYQIIDTRSNRPISSGMVPVPDAG